LMVISGVAALQLSGPPGLVVGAVGVGEAEEVVGSGAGVDELGAGVAEVEAVLPLKVLDEPLHPVSARTSAAAARTPSFMCQP